MDTFPNFPEIWRTLQGRVAELERKTLGLAKAELDANRAAAWQTPTLLNDYFNAPGGYSSAAYYKDTFGRVYLRGLVRTGSPAPAGLAPLFTLPVGYRPVFIHIFPSGMPDNFGGATLLIEPNGDVHPGETVVSSDDFNLDIISFRVL